MEAEDANAQLCGFDFVDDDDAQSVSCRESIVRVRHQMPCRSKRRDQRPSQLAAKLGRSLLCSSIPNAARRDRKYADADTQDLGVDKA
ncbi:hypothetical protein PHSY_005796 [Pseudozyma hubeiensis SY62]|uniref:Uncharacterized protein n=1 Tax=Pseudozyma hubeiensis (strain SY62) TaxID=1305764 RepID=R9PAC4_PSEHS|nr:hypothetical protein PHSY_005796 [Pseudozyma hubeiensis SY62]GAC98207.1 hypothetical protein PHSY_005796 [Pseudozyma hubeiensis SY62]